MAERLAQSIEDQQKQLAPKLRRVASRRGEGFEGIFMMEAQYVPVDGADLLKVLEGTDAWQQIGVKNASVRNELVSKIGHAYEDLGDDAYGVFDRRARAISIVVGIVFALVFNVNAIRLIDVFVNQPAARQATLKKQGAILDLYAESRKNGGSAGEVTVAQLNGDVDDLRKTLARLETPGLPVGFDWYPWCRTDNDPQCPLEWPDWKNFAPWLLGVLLTGLLVGLGAPFWYDVVSRLSKTARQLKSGEAPAGQTPQRGSTPPAEGRQPPRTPEATSATRRRVPGLEGS
jgi:hypothetical protein